MLQRCAKMDATIPASTCTANQQLAALTARYIAKHTATNLYDMVPGLPEDRLNRLMCCASCSHCQDADPLRAARRKLFELVVECAQRIEAMGRAPYTEDPRRRKEYEKRRWEKEKAKRQEQQARATV